MVPNIRPSLALALLLAAAPARSPAEIKAFALQTLEGLKLHKVAAEPAAHKGIRAIRVTEAGGMQGPGEDRLVLVAAAEIGDGTIELQLAGEPGEGAAAVARGFVGVAFRVAPDVSKFECIYLRPTNGRAEDQERRNHSVQYVSFPEWPWQRTRKETPGRYETYADLVPGEWTRMKIEVRGVMARLWVNDAEQPTLIVKDLKLGSVRGGVGLWVGPGTIAHFAGLKVSQ